MAASTRPLVWDFYRAVGSASGLGGTVEYYEESGQSIWLDSNGLTTETTTVEDGHWENTPWSEDIQILPDSHSLLALDHPSNGVLYGAAVRDGRLWFYRYVYAMDIGDLVRSGSWKASNDSAIAQMNLQLLNVSNDLYGAEATLFQPGARLSLAVVMGDSAPYDIGVAHLDDVAFDPLSEIVTLSGRNQTGFYLKDQTFGADFSWTGNGQTVVENILAWAGIKKYQVGTSATTWTWVFDPKNTVLEGLEHIGAWFSGWELRELPSGMVVVGYPEWIAANFQATGYYQLNVGREVTRRRTRKSADAAYCRVYVTGKDAQGVALAPITQPVRNFDFWGLPAKKTYHDNAPDGLTQEELQAYAEDLAERLQYVGMVDSFTLPFMQPQLLVGDVAQVYYTGDEQATSLGTITSITHSFGQTGFSTAFTVDSGGAESENAGAAVTKTRALGGYTRQQNVLDFMRNVAHGY